MRKKFKHWIKQIWKGILAGFDFPPRKQPGSFQDDALKLHNDWNKVNCDLLRALDKYGKENK